MTLFTRASCHLCEDMWQHLQEIQTERKFELVQVDVDSEPELQQRFGSLIPVLLGDDRIICNYFLDPVALEQYLAGVV
ncbi:MAG: glutaredoxin family protein [Gammaproteobacteria bacterium]|nr:glutaredoxin family protein [Gammaproteobacteria bacterium]MCB1860240.1 glutaredoxin family protein [Gammaproteobacteria bacterium]MCB1904911.1 glutaredoxin family protein [Gammaproteobacteria bacterium]